MTKPPSEPQGRAEIRPRGRRRDGPASARARKSRAQPIIADGGGNGGGEAIGGGGKRLGYARRHHGEAGVAGGRNADKTRHDAPDRAEQADKGRHGGDHREIGRPPSAFISTSTWARVSFSATRCAALGDGFAGARRCALRSRRARRPPPAAAPWRSRTARESRDRPNRPSMMRSQHQIEARPSTTITDLPTSPAWRNRASGESESVSMMRPMIAGRRAGCGGAVAFPFGILPFWDSGVECVGETAIRIDCAIDKSNFGIGI